MMCTRTRAKVDTRQAADRRRLVHALEGQSSSNYAAIFAGFLAKGIAYAAISPRRNVFTRSAWRALGFRVRPGEVGVNIVTYVKTGKLAPNMVALWTTVYHLSQTDDGGQHE
jgi:hypothetical protein